MTSLTSTAFNKATSFSESSLPVSRGVKKRAAGNEVDTAGKTTGKTVGKTAGLVAFSSP